MNKGTGGGRTKAPKPLISLGASPKKRGGVVVLGVAKMELDKSLRANYFGPLGSKKRTLRNKAVASPRPDNAADANIRIKIRGLNQEASATKSIVIVDTYEKTSDNAPAMGLLHEYLKTLGVPKSRLPDVAADIHALALARAKAEVAGRAAPVAAPAPFAEALEAMTLKERRAALIQHYGLLPDKDGKYALPKEKRWETVRGKNPAPEKFLTWLNEVFPDRREIGMVLSDLKHLDKSAYDKVMLWAGARSKMPRAVINSFDLPTRITKYDPVRDANAPKSWAEVSLRVERGEDSFKKSKSIFFTRSPPHSPSDLTRAVSRSCDTGKSLIYLLTGFRVMPCCV